MAGNGGVVVDFRIALYRLFVDAECLAQFSRTGIEKPVDRGGSADKAATSWLLETRRRATERIKAARYLARCDKSYSRSHGARTDAWLRCERSDALCFGASGLEPRRDFVTRNADGIYGVAGEPTLPREASIPFGPVSKMVPITCSFHN